MHETRQLGEPVIGLFRTALGRDPDVHELAAFAHKLRDGAALPALADALVATPGFRRRYGQASRLELASALCRNAFGSDAAGRNAAILAAELGATEGQLVAAVASAALAQRRIPLLPGLAPGAPPDDPVAYRLWVDEYDRPDPASLARLPRLSGPRITVAMISGDTQAEAVLRTVGSLRGQVYADWELCLAARTLSPWSRDAIQRLAGDEPRVRLIEPALLRDALTVGSGSLACLLAPGDRLPPSAFYEVVAAFAAHPETKLLYSDEDVEEAGVRHSPRLKPGFSSDATLTGDEIGQLAVYRIELLAEVGGLPNGAEPFRELARRAAMTTGPGRVRHLPAVLCHRGEPPAPDAGMGASPRVPVPEPAPLVTIIVLTKDRAGLLAACAQGVLERTAYGAIELLVVDNGSAEPEALSLLADLGRQARVRVLRRPGPFNFAALNNAAASEARGDILLLLNSDTEVMQPGWLGEMAAHAARPDVGAVGARLLYPDGTVQHAGILLGPDGAATHVGRGASPDDPGYLGQLARTRDLSAVTGACLAIRASVWRMVGGMDERLAVTWNDVDLCLRVRRAGLRVVWTPHATLLHREAATRGHEAEDPAREARFRAEQALMRELWGDALEHDPFLNPNLVATEAGPLALARPRHRRLVQSKDLHSRAKAGIPD